MIKDDRRFGAAWRLAAGAVGLAIGLGGGLLVPAAAHAQTGFEEWVIPGQEGPFTVPSGVCQVNWLLYGGSGGDGSNGIETSTGGDGGWVETHMPVTAGAEFYVQVGTEGRTGAEGGAGGMSGTAPSGGSSSGGGGGGGGASIVRSGATITGEPVIVAAGGGGGGNTEGAFGGPATVRGAFGNSSGSNGGGRGGTHAAPGTGGVTSVSGGVNGGNGVDLVGGAAPAGAGGGGGGFMAGGAGSASGTGASLQGAGGGSGASYVADASTDWTNSHSGNSPLVRATFVACPPAPAPAPAKPAAPQLSSAVSTLPGAVDLVLVPGAPVQGLPVDRYQVSTNGTGGPWTTLITQPQQDTPHLTATVTGLTPGMTYPVTVRAMSDDVASDPSEVKQVTVAPIIVVPFPTPTPTPIPTPTPPVTPVPDTGGEDVVVGTPGAPTGVAAKAERASVLVSWQPPTSGGAVDHYEVTLLPSGQAISTTQLSARFGAVAGQSYTATVVAVSAARTAGPAGSATTQAEAASPVVPAAVPSAPLTLTTDKGQISSTTPGAKLTVIGTGFLPFSTATIVIYSEPQVLGTVTTDADGNFSREVEVPATLAAGQHSLVASGTAPDGTERFMRMDVTVAAATGAVPAAAEGGLAYTGASVLVPAGVGLAALIGGTVLLLVSRRRRTA
ncbi:fibronectin type III domain-containing protein [Modestobacter roseus]|uniref:fibronectin type III domain-containing protein n=1 Tax=Modestobacter roseus TaxID=1181884 RepID=UPI001885BF08|nr:fibronectin type III domain-containing protein [Modestobacter roseus]